MGKWYFLLIDVTSSYEYEDDSRVVSRVVFIPPGGSIAKYVLAIEKKVNPYFEICGAGGYSEGKSFSVLELSLLLPDGRKITGFKPMSIAHLMSKDAGEYVQLLDEEVD